MSHRLARVVVVLNVVEPADFHDIQGAVVSLKVAETLALIVVLFFGLQLE